jgi:hypothetical protein
MWRKDAFEQPIDAIEPHTYFGYIWQVNGSDKAEPFKRPVTKREAPDYHTVIRKPMCLNGVYH